MTPHPLLQVKDLSKYFAVTRGAILARKIGDIKAVDRISFDIYSGETLGLVGESGCGKTTTGRLILRLSSPVVARSSIISRTLPIWTAGLWHCCAGRCRSFFRTPTPA